MHTLLKGGGGSIAHERPPFRAMLFRSEAAKPLRSEAKKLRPIDTQTCALGVESGALIVVHPESYEVLLFHGVILSFRCF